MKQYIEHDCIKRSFVIKQVESRSFQEIDKAEETDSNIDCPSLIKDELKEFRIRKAQKTKIRECSFIDRYKFTLILSEYFRSS